MKYLRCEDLTPHDRQLLGGIVPCTYPDAPHWVIQRLGELMWALEGVPLILCVDQLEDMFDMEDAPTRFRRSLATLCDIVSRLPSAIVVISCLQDYYDEVKGYLVKPTQDRIQGSRGPINLKALRESDEVVQIIAERLKFLYQSASLSLNQDDPPIPCLRPWSAACWNENRGMCSTNARPIVIGVCGREACLSYPFDEDQAAATSLITHRAGLERTPSYRLARGPDRRVRAGSGPLRCDQRLFRETSRPAHGFDAEGGRPVRPGRAP